MIYNVRCDICNNVYVGCTTRRLKTRIQEHLWDARNPIARNLFNVAKYYLNQHNGDLTGFQFVGIERVNRPIRGGDWRRLLLNHEAFWILRLNTSYPVGLNYRLDLIFLY